MLLIIFEQFQGFTKIKFSNTRQSQVFLMSLSDEIDLRVVKKCTGNGSLLFTVFRHCRVVSTHFDHGYEQSDCKILESIVWHYSWQKRSLTMLNLWR